MPACKTGDLGSNRGPGKNFSRKLKIMVNYLKIVNILIMDAYIKPNFLFVWDCENSVNRSFTLSLFLEYSPEIIIIIRVISLNSKKVSVKAVDRFKKFNT